MEGRSWGGAIGSGVGGTGAGRWRGAVPRVSASAPRGAVEDQGQQAAAARALAGSALRALRRLHGAWGWVDRCCQLAGKPGPFHPPGPNPALI